jgi:hypothetical protein
LGASRLDCRYNDGLCNNEHCRLGDLSASRAAGAARAKQLPSTNGNRVIFSMPRPVSLICAEGGSEDKTTGLISVFNVIEQISFKRAEPNQPQMPFKMRIITSWLREESDRDEQQFECEVSFLQPASHTEVPLAKTDFAFVKGKPLFKTIILFESALPIDGEGLMEVHCKVRHKNSDTWQIQSHPIIVKEIHETQPQGTAANGKSD